jgi:hypothetical protein
VLGQGGSSGGATAAATVLDAPLTATGAAISGTEGLPLSPAPAGDVLVAKFSDADFGGTVADYTASINWGDGTSTPATRLVAGGSTSGVTYSVFGQHTYAEEGSYPVQVTITDTGGAQAAAHAETDVADAPLSPAPVPAVFLVAFTEGVAATAKVALFTDANPNATVADFTTEGGTVIVDWGDGSPAARTVKVTQPGGAGTTFVISATHTYADSGATGGTGSVGAYNVTVHVEDKGGASANIITSVLVADLSIPLQGSLNPSSDSGESATDAITKVNQPSFTGTTEPFAHVSLFATPTGGGPAVMIGQAEAASDGSWSITSSRVVD